MKVLSSILLLHRSTYNIFVRRGSGRGFTQSTCLYLNRIFVDSDDCIFEDNGDIITQFNSTDYRYDHIKNILKLSPGDKFRSGVLNVGITDNATVLNIHEGVDNKKKTSKQINESDKSNNSSKSIASDENKNDNRIVNNNNNNILIKKENTIDIRIGTKNELIQPKTRHCIDLILAAPRPLRLERIMPIVSCLGVRHVAIIGANKVEKHYFGSQLMRRPDIMRLKLIEGLEQAEVDCYLPTVSIHKSFNQFIKYQLTDVLLSHNLNSDDDGINYSSSNSNSNDDDDNISRNNENYNHDIKYNSNDDDNGYSNNDRDSLPIAPLNEEQQINENGRYAATAIDSSSSVNNNNNDHHTIAATTTTTSTTTTANTSTTTADATTPTDAPTTAIRYIKVITQPLYPTMTRVDPVTKEVTTLPRSTRFSSIFQEEFAGAKSGQKERMLNKDENNVRAVIAIGPEGGWTYDELEAFIHQGFRLVHMGERILRTDIAVQTSLGIVHELLGYYLQDSIEDE